ncbi:MAG: hypothetical protein E6713_17285 [Sporomusaceae bacterium]|nr:hypothetical protein [Sporomusaceae bacterium]
MLLHILFGAAIGMLIGHLIPPGYFFWFLVGAAAGFFVQRYWRR